MSGYLQRLVERAAPRPPPAAPGLTETVPAGAVTSPLAALDQRLHDPALAAALLSPFAASAAEEGPDAGREDVAWRPQPPPALFPGKLPRSAEVRAEPPARVAAAASPPAPPAHNGEDMAPRREGSATFFERIVERSRHPAFQEPAASVGTRDAVVPPPPPRAVPPSPQLRPDPAAERGAPPPAARPLEVEAKPAAPRPQPSEPRSTGEPVPASPLPPAVSSPVLPARQDSAPAPQPAMVIDVQPPPLPPPAPLPPTRSAAAPAPAAPRKEVQASPRRTGEETRRSEPLRDERRAPRPPVSAEAVSLIGPLARRRRATTLFGLRRR